MESFSTLKRVPRRAVFILYCISITFIFFCAFYTYSISNSNSNFIRPEEERTSVKTHAGYLGDTMTGSIPHLLHGKDVATLYSNEKSSFDSLNFVVTSEISPKTKQPKSHNALLKSKVLRNHKKNEENSRRRKNHSVNSFSKDSTLVDDEKTSAHLNPIISEETTVSSEKLNVDKSGNSRIQKSSFVAEGINIRDTSYVSKDHAHRNILISVTGNKANSLQAVTNMRNTQTLLYSENSTCKSSTSSPKLILLWTPFFDSWDYMPEGPFNHCSACTNCEVTTNRKRLVESDAVLFHARDMSLVDLPSTRLSNQRWIFYCLESPPYSDFPGMQFMHGMFNWTMTYRSDSDIVTPYGNVQKSYPKKRLDRIALETSWRRKTQSVVWMSSHCPTHGGRDEYVAQLSKYIDVDEYGSCGTLSCPKNITEQCLQRFAENYKFFLAFENSICNDYVTEKFFRTLKYDVVPVVFGGAKYEKHAPPGSYIDALSFKSPKHLAYFLAGVGRDFSLYSTYFEWRKEYVVKTGTKKECALCAMLHEPNHKPSIRENLKKWWVQDGRCRKWEAKG